MDTLTAELQRRIWAMKVRCYHKILRISYKDHVTSEEVCAKIQQAMRLHEDLLTIMKRHKIRWYVHVSHSSGLAKTILQGRVKGGRKQSGQKKGKKDNIKEWTGLEFAKSLRAVENREKWRKLWNKLWCPNNPSWLRDRWRWPCPSFVWANHLFQCSLNLQEALWVLQVWVWISNCSSLSVLWPCWN